MNRKSWKDKLTKKELDHLRKDANVRTLASAKTTFEEHERMRRANPDGIEPCLTCKTIARKLGLLDESTGRQTHDN
jgi:hypothetical protein